MSTFTRFMGRAITVGYLGGLAFAGIEGMQVLMATQMGPSNKTLRSWNDLFTTLAIPLAAYPLLAALLAALAAAVFYPVFARRLRSSSPAGMIGILVGIIAAIGAGAWALMATNPFITIGFLVAPSRILFNLQTLGVGILAGVGIGWAVSSLCGRFTPRNVALGFGALWPSGMAAAMLLLWAKRNLPLWHTAWKVVLGIGVVIIAFVVMTAVLARLLGMIYRPTASLARRLALPVVMCGGSAAALAFTTSPGFPAMEGGTGGKGIKTILFTVDTLRADRLGCYGYRRATSPVMDSLAAQGTMFLRARSQSPWTLSSIASFMTSTYPSVNAVLTGNNKLDRARITLAEQFQKHGVLTQAIVTNGWLQDTFGIAQGFDGFRHSGEVFNWGRYQRMIWMRLARRFWPERFPVNQTFLAKDVVDRAVDWIKVHHDRDFFLWVHTVDPHDPYQPPREYNTLFADGPYKGRFKENSGLLHLLRTGARLSPEDKAQLELLYDREVRYTDDQIGRLVEALREVGIWDQTLFIIGSDHGEEFWEHDGLMHGHTLYDENLWVPLIFRFPGAIPAGKVVEQPVRMLDLMPTILDMWGVPGSPEMQGISLLPLIRGEEAREAPVAFAEALLYFDELKSMVKDGYKLVLNPSSGKVMLFDLADDPKERWDLARTDSTRAQQMLGELREWMRASAAQAESLPHTEGGSKAHIDADTEAQLRALGYLH